LWLRVKVWKIRLDRFYPNSAPSPSSAASSFFFSSSSFFFLSSGGAAVGFCSAGAVAAAAGAAVIMVGAALRASSMLTSLSDATRAFIWIGSAVTPAAVRTADRDSSFMGFPAL